MAAPFTPEEQQKIRQALRSAALRHARADGMKRTTVDMLTEETGISKGAFYHFYPTKEMLFLDMLESWYQEIARQAETLSKAHPELPPVERGMLMLRETIRCMSSASLSRFIRDDVPALLRKLPEEVLREHYTSDDEFILHLLHMADIPLKVKEDVAVAIVKLLLMSLINAGDIGPSYPEALQALSDSACRQLIVGQG